MSLIIRTDPDLQFTRVSGKGYFLDSEFLVGPRSSSAESNQSGGLMSSAKKVGYFVYSPFKMLDGRVVIVNRGWIPKEWSDKKEDRKVYTHLSVNLKD